MDNPYPEKLIDESSGIEVSNMQHEVWNEGARAERDRAFKLAWETILKDCRDPQVADAFAKYLKALKGE